MKQIRNPLPSDWRFASCRTDPDAWNTSDPEAAAEARYACRRFCPLRDACLDAAMANEGALIAKFRTGIRGGMTPIERADRAKQTRQEPT